jgi:hypothetical protein
MPYYALYGMEPTCSNARPRGILIHPNVWQFATYPLPAMWFTEGCFGLSWLGFYKIENYIKMSKKPILLWAYQ